MRIIDDWLPEDIVNSSCGILGILRKESASKIGVEEAIRGIESVRYRGSDLGAGFSAFNLVEPQSSPSFRLQAFVRSGREIARIKEMVLGAGWYMLDESVPNFTGDGFETYAVSFETKKEEIQDEVDALNAEFSSVGGFLARIYNCSRFQRVFKGVGYPEDVARQTGVRSACRSADLWLAHTRQPTNSPGLFPIWSHPFAASEWSVVHNGDISSFGANYQFLKSVGVRSLVGTDSEAIAFILDHLTRVEGRSLAEAARILTPATGEEGATSSGEHNSGCRLDGPYSVAAGYCDGEDLYLLGLLDRSKFRPMVVGEDESNYYIASEESQIRALSPRAQCWRPASGSVVVFSMRRGMIESGRTARGATADSSTPIAQSEPVSILAREKSHSELNRDVADCLRSHAAVRVAEARGHRFLGSGLASGQELVIDGTPGNCLGNLLEGGRIVVNGNGADDIGDTMNDGTIIVRGDAGDVVGQAMQGGVILVSGNVGNRVGIQMRAYEGRAPILVVGGTAGDYLGEYMAGGTIAVLNLRAEPIVSRQIGNGMVGGRIYIRGRIGRERIGLQPKRADIDNYLASLFKEGQIDGSVLSRALSSDHSLEALEEVLPKKVERAVSRFYLGKYSTRISSDYGFLGASDLLLLKSAFDSFGSAMGCAEELERAVHHDRFTVISVAGSAGIESAVEE